MMKNKTVKLMALSLLALLATACSHLFPAESNLPTAHPEPLTEGRPICSQCHENIRMRGALKPYGTFDHTALFVRNHKFPAERDTRVCAVCHAGSFCNDCHATQAPNKPSLLYGNRPDREMIHRGDYITRHKIEGKVDPASCYRCHGRANQEKCVACHR